MSLPGDVARLVGREKDRERGHLLRPAEAAHGLAIDESLLDLGARLAGRLRHVLDAPFERGRLNSSWADRVRSDALLDEVGGDRLGEADDGGLCRPIGIAVWHAAD